MRRHRQPAGFTLVELLVAIGLMTILITSCVLIFAGSSYTARITDSRLRIYTFARAALDQLDRDLSSMLPMSGGSQIFWLRDDAHDPSSGARDSNVTATNDLRHYEHATDLLGFTCITSINGVPTPARIVYRLVRDMDGTRNRTAPKFINGVEMPPRQLYVLRKELWNLDGTKLLPSGGTDNWGDLCYYVLSFNVEYLSAGGQYSQIAPGPSGASDGPFPGPALSAISIDNPGVSISGAPVDPMGEASGGADLNDAVDPRQPSRLIPKYVVPAVRVTLRIVEDREARSERVFTREVWLPGG